MINKKYQNIVEELVRKSFPKLSRPVKFININPGFNIGIGTIIRGWKRDYIIYIGSQINKKSGKALKGFLTHELCHLEDLQNMSPFMSFIRLNILNDLIMFLPLYFPLERSADMKSIEKGYARELYQNHKKVESRYPKWLCNIVYKKGYMKPEQIKSYAKKIGKW